MSLGGFGEFEQLLYSLSKEYRKDKAAAQLISPATYIENTTRANANVINWAGWAAVDVDENTEEVLSNLTKELYYVCYSTASSTVENPKFRLVFPLTTEVPADKIKHFWYALNKELGDIGDAQTKDLSRMYYIPGLYEGANNFIWTNEGAYIDPNVLMRRFTYIEKTGSSFLDKLPPEVRKQMLAHRKNTMTNTSISWSCYRDCRFVNKRMVNEYRHITDTGWYSKMYAIMVNIAGNAIKQKYPITAGEITTLCKEIDNDTGCWYKNRPFNKEADRAIEFAYGNI